MKNMKKNLLLVLTLCSAWSLQAQTDSTQKQPQDTIRVGGMVIVRDHKEHEDASNKEEKKDNGKKFYKKRSNANTNWWIFDIGINQFNDKTNYASAEVQNATNGMAPGASKDWFSLRNNKSININFWFFAHRQPVIKNVVHLKYGILLELNNYRFERPVLLNTNPTQAIMVASNVNTYTKNKLVTNYLTVPMMLNFNLAPKNKHGLAFSAGMSAGYLYSSYQKTVSGTYGKQKVRNSFELQPWKISYVGELNLGPLRLYGTMSPKSMFKRGLDFQPYSVGFRFSNW